MLKRKIVFLILAVACLKTAAQYDVSFSHYWGMEPYYNPAAVGKENVINAVGAYAIDLAGFEHNPQTAYFGADLPFYFLNSYHGAGVSYMNDRIGLFVHQRLALQYALRKRLLGGNLSVGVQVGMINEKFDGSKLDLEESNDPAFTKAEVDGNSVDLAVGLYYKHKKWYAGVSAQHITSPLIKLGETNELKIDPTYYFTGGYNIKLRNPFLTIHPTVLVRTDMNAFRADISGRLEYNHENKMLYGGLSYSPSNSITALIGGSFHGINVGYSYEMYTSAVNPGNGSHELFVNYQMDINLTKKGRNKHKSVRIL